MAPRKPTKAGSTGEDPSSLGEGWSCFLGKSLVKEADLAELVSSGTLAEGQGTCGGEAVVPSPGDGRTVVFATFFAAGLRLPCDDFLASVLATYEVLSHRRAVRRPIYSMCHDQRRAYASRTKKNRFRLRELHAAAGMAGDEDVGTSKKCKRAVAKGGQVRTRRAAKDAAESDGGEEEEDDREAGSEDDGSHGYTPSPARVKSGVGSHVSPVRPQDIAGANALLAISSSAAKPGAVARKKKKKGKVVQVGCGFSDSEGRLSLLAGAPSGRAVASSSIAAASSSPAYPLSPAETSGSASPPATVVLPPRFRLRSPLPRPRCAGRRRHHLSRHRSAVLFPGKATASPEFRRNAVARVGLSFLLVDVSSGSPLPPGPCISRRCRPSLGMPRRRPRPRLPSDRTPPVSVVVFTVHPRRLVVSRCRLRRRIRSGAFHVVPVSVQLPPAALIVSSPAPVVVVVVLSSFSVVVAPVLVFVLGSASSSLVPAASRLRPRIAAEAVPSPFVSVVPVCLRRARSSLSFPRLVTWW
uniref:Cell wall protein-like n=1 Tax=Oryza sativa subsp. japonica TaxID=39947 RepID=Q6EQA5_ORYSJ|nr:cell wall protein-like [Oryza sativa Japonica Group]BAD29165.1 cell wall protein-like [Oryza sativa Japonica Group]